MAALATAAAAAAAAGAAGGGAVDAAGESAGDTANEHARVPLTLLPPVRLNERVADYLGALTVEGLIGCEFLEELKSYHKLPSEALEALRQRWEPIAAVQLLGRASEPETYNYEIAAIFQSYMVSLLHSSLCCHALEKESAKRKAKAKRSDKIKPLKLRPVIGGRYDLQWRRGEWHLLGEWDSILGGSPKTGCWQQEVCFSEAEQRAGSRPYPPMPSEVKAAGAENTTLEALTLGEALDLMVKEVNVVLNTITTADTELEPEMVLERLSDEGIAACARATLLWLSKYDVGSPMGETALASLYNVWNCRTSYKHPWIAERRNAHLMKGATYIDLIVIVGENCNGPDAMWSQIGFKDAYDAINFNLGQTYNLGEALRRQLGLTPRDGRWSLESPHEHFMMLLAAATRQLKPLQPMTRVAIDTRK